MQQLSSVVTPAITAVTRLSVDHVEVTFNTAIAGGTMGPAFNITGNTNNGEAQDDDFNIGVDFVNPVAVGNAWTYNAALSTLTFVGGGTLPNSAGTVT